MPRGIYDRFKKDDVADVPQGTIEQAKPIAKERAMSDETDRKGPFHPLCHTCKHREDMHHTWHAEQVLEDFRDVTGRVSQRLKTVKTPVFDGQRPCQHACKCTDYK